MIGTASMHAVHLCSVCAVLLACCDRCCIPCAVLCLITLFTVRVCTVSVLFCSVLSALSMGNHATLAALFTMTFCCLIGLSLNLWRSMHSNS